MPNFAQVVPQAKPPPGRQVIVVSYLVISRTPGDDNSMNSFNLGIDAAALASDERGGVRASSLGSVKHLATTHSEP
jgi:hypothetical protein